MTGRSYEDVRSDYPLVRKVQKRLYKQNKNWLAILTGETGSGKSWTALKLAQEVDPDFNVDKVVLDPIEFLERIAKRGWGQGDCVVFDEAGVSMSSKEYMTVVNRSVEDILETFRRRNIAVIFTVPSQKNVDKDLRRLLHDYLQTKTINYARERVNIKWLKMQYNPKVDKIYYKYYKKSTDKAKMPRKIRNVWVGKPDKEIIEAYEEKRENYQNDLNRKKLDRVKEVIEKKRGNKEKEPTKKEKIREELKESDEIDDKKLAKKYDTTRRYVRQIKNMLD